MTLQERIAEARTKVSQLELALTEAALQYAKAVSELEVLEEKGEQAHDG